MNEYADKSKEIKSAAVTNRTPQQLKSETAFLVDNRPTAVAQRKLQGLQPAGSEPIQKRKNETGLPDNLKAGVETLSGMGMDDVKVHYNSSQPAQLQALAYAQGTDIHIAPGQEKHLPHEAWHVAQQKQGRVKSNFQQKKGVNINDDAGLESEADQMGKKALQIKPSSNASVPGIQRKTIGQAHVVQRVIGRARPGTKVIEITTKQVYIISGYNSEKGYKLTHNAIHMPPRYVLPDNPDFEIFADADIMAAPTTSSSIFSSISSVFSGSKEPPTVSGSFERTRREDVARAWPRIAPRVNEIKQEAIHNEKLKPGASAFYNAAGLGAHTLHRIILEIYEELHGVATRNHVFFRAPGNAPREDALKGPQVFLSTRDRSSTWSDHRETDSMMSANITVSANATDTSESTFDILQTGGLFDVEPKKTVEIIRKMLANMGMADNHAAVILGEVDRLAKSIAQIKARNGRENAEAVLYQTFIPKGLISKLVYIAQKNGHPLDEISTLRPEKALLAIAAAGKELKNSSMSSYGSKYAAQLDRMPGHDKEILFRSPEFTHMLLEATKADSFWTVFNHDTDPQARILMDPTVFAAPSGQAETITYSNLSRNTTRTLESGLASIRGTVKHQKLANRINDRIILYGAVFEQFHAIQNRLAQLPMEELQIIFNKTTHIIAKVDEDIQLHVAEFIGSHDLLPPIIESETGLMVRCRGREERFDLDTPARMLPAEFEELCVLLRRLSVPSAPVSKMPDLLTF